MKLKRERSAQKRPFDWFRIVSLAVAVALATLPLTLSGPTIASFTMTKYITNDIQGDEFRVVKQGALLTIPYTNGTQGSGQNSYEGAHTTITLPGGYWGVVAKGQDGKKTDGAGGAGGDARGMFYAPGNSFDLVISTRGVGATNPGTADARGGDGIGSSQNTCDGGYGGNATVLYLNAVGGTIVCCAGGGGGGGDDTSTSNGGAGGNVSNGGSGNGGTGAGPTGTANVFNGSGSSTSDGLTTYNAGSMVRGANGINNGANDSGAGGGGMPGGAAGNNSGGGGSGGASYVQMSLPTAGGGFNYYEVLPATTTFLSLKLLYFGEATPGTSFVTNNTW
ncbi:MAG: glycine-rich protein [Firmicutes bacterium]|nr:glycine-rich protein [Bacillota bacterium]